MTHLVKYISRMAAVLTGCLFISGCENDVKDIDSLLGNKTAVEEAFNIESYLSQDAVMKARLKAPYMLRYQADSPYVEFPKKLHVDFYNDSAVIESYVDAKYAKFTEYNRKVYLRDSVVVINKANGDTLKTEELWWDQDKQEFYTEKKVEIRKRRETVFGKGLRAAQNFSSYDIFEFYGTMLVPESGLR